jgi:hypothetical protein
VKAPSPPTPLPWGDKGVCYWIEIFRELLPPSLLEQVKKSENEEEWVKERLSELELIVDSCEQPRQRPEEYEEQKKYYSVN